jgi:hypothetical protein
MADIKTKVNDASVEQFLEGITDSRRRDDAFAILKMMKAVTRMPPKMWGPAIVGFGQHHYKYADGREGVMCAVGFSPRKQALTLYVSPKQQPALLKKLGKCTTGGGCLYIKKLDDVNMVVLRQLVAASFERATKEPV